MNIMERIEKGFVIFDGGMGTMIQPHMKLGELPEMLNITLPDVIYGVHKAYLDAGADVVETNSLNANCHKLKRIGKSVDEVISAAVGNARRAVEDAGHGYVALSMGSTGIMLEPLGDLSFDDAVDIYAEMAAAGEKAGADLILIETVSDLHEIKAAVYGAKQASKLPVAVTMTFEANGRTLTGADIKTSVATLEALGVDIVGMNCGLGPDLMCKLMPEMAKSASVPVLINPNAGLPRSENGRTVYDVDPDAFAAWMKKIAAMGVQAVGGCCGTTPDHIRKTVETVRPLPFIPVSKKHRTVVSSYSRAVEIGKKPLIIGERINPTGKKKFKEALRDNNIEYILEEGLRQEDSGAHILDVNVGLPEIDEPRMMETVVTRLQSILALPLQIDTSDPAAMERGMRLYNGKPMVNSVNGKRESLESVLPLVAKYGGVVVGLTLDEGGIPETADGRIEIAKKIYRAADRFGVPREDVVIDALAMTISSDTKGALVTLETLRRVRDELGGHTILGVSNISFGLPERSVINAHFLTMAMQMGLSCAIMNPGNEDMILAYRAFLALSDMDPQCMGYIDTCANIVRRPVSAAGPDGAGTGGNKGAADTVPGAEPAVSAAVPGGAAGKNHDQSGSMSLAESIRRGMGQKAAEAARALLTEGVPALELINAELIPALDVVGKGFEKGTIFLPQLLMSAEAAKAAFEVIKETMRDEKREARGRIILATVKGDIHDIGKNIVKVMLENYGYDILDLGRDVAPETIVETAQREDIRLVGLSALMTTTVVSMEETIRQLREKKPGTRVVVGGAVMTQEYADSIGADCYAPDAMATVHYAEEVFG